jgi:DNA gyrase subunit A
VYGIVKEELSELGRRFGDDRRTEIVPAEGELDLEQLIREEDMVISITQTGYIKRVAASTYRQQKRGGVGVMGMDTKDDDWIEHLLVASTHDYVLFFTSVGKVYRLKVHELPEGNRQGRGRAVVNLLPLREGEHVRTVIATRDFGEGMYLMQATKAGIVKKTLFKEYDTPRKSDGIIAINIREGDELIGVRLTSGEDDVLLTSRRGQTVRFDENEARAMGRATGGVIGMKLRKGDGKRTRVAEYPRKGRGTMGVLTIRLVQARGAIVGALVVGPRQEILVITESGTVQRTPVDGISQMSRATQGVIVQRLREGDRISAVAMVDASVDIDGPEDEPLPLESGDGAAPLDGASPTAQADGLPEAGSDEDDGDGVDDEDL